MFYGGGVKRGRRVVPGLLLALVLSASTGCAEAEMAQRPPSSTPPIPGAFTSRQQAELEAKRVYLRYLKVSDEVSDGGSRVDAFRPLLATSAYLEEVESQQELTKRHLRAVGPSRLKAFRLQSADLRTGNVKAYACVDFSEVRVLSGRKDVTPQDRLPRQTSLAEFERRENRLVLKLNGKWPGQSIC